MLNAIKRRLYRKLNPTSRTYFLNAISKSIPGLRILPPYTLNELSLFVTQNHQNPFCIACYFVDVGNDKVAEAGLEPAVFRIWA